jgi:hypothetical protein
MVYIALAQNISTEFSLLHVPVAVAAKIPGLETVAGSSSCVNSIASRASTDTLTAGLIRLLLRMPALAGAFKPETGHNFISVLYHG